MSLAIYIAAAIIVPAAWGAIVYELLQRRRTRRAIQMIEGYPARYSNDAAGAERYRDENQMD